MKQIYLLPRPQKPPVSDADHDGDNDATESKLVKSKETAASANPNLGKNINTIA